MEEGVVFAIIDPLSSILEPYWANKSNSRCV